MNKFANPTGGADVHFAVLAGQLMSLGHEVRVLATIAGEAPNLAGALIRPVVTHASRGSLSTRQRMTVLRTAIWNREAAQATASLLDDFRPDIAHVHKLHPQLSVAPVVVASRRGIPLVQTLHDHEMCAANPADASGGWFDTLEDRVEYRTLNSLLYGIRRTVQRPRVHRFVAVSNYLAERHRRNGIAADVVYNFLPHPGSAPIPAGERSGVVFAGRFDRAKGIDLATSLARRSPSVEFHFAGSGTLQSDVEEARDELQNVTYHGWLGHEELQRLIGGARVVLLPARNPEGGPLAVIQAFGAGTPVVACDAGGLGEYVRCAQGGAVVEPRIDSLVAAVGQLLDNDEYWQRCADNALNAARGVFSPAGRVADLERIYRDTIETARA